MKTKKILLRILSITAAFLLSLFVLFESAFSIRVSAETVISYEQTNVMDDLSGMTINGVPFNVKDYGYDETRGIQVLSFVEYGYSLQKDMQDRYALYVYIYNPKGLSIENDTTRNRIQFTYGSENIDSMKLPLIILNKSSDDNLNNLFYKMKVDLRDEEKSVLLSTLDSSARQYEVSGIELLSDGQSLATEYFVSSSFVYSGFAAGFGENESEESTLQCIRNSSESLQLGVHQTYYRPKGTNGSSITQDTLMSVYFSIPNAVLEANERLSGVRCSWVKVMTDWIYITGREDIYNAFIEQIGIKHDTGSWIDDKGTFSLLDDEPFPYGFVAWDVNGDIVAECNYSGDGIKRLDYIFWTGSSLPSSADDYVLSSDDLYEWMKNYDKQFGQSGDNFLKIDGKAYPPYNAELFTKATAKTTNVVISADDEYSLTDVKVTQSWWQRIWSDSTIEYINTFDNIEGIKEVTADDMKYTDGEICNRLFINENDIKAFKDFYKTETEKENTVFLLRYDVGDFQAVEVSQGKPDTSGFVQGFVDGDTNGYIAREHLYLNFDVIDVEFSRDGEAIIIPIVSNPNDVIADITPPPITHSDSLPKWVYLVIIGLAVLALIVVVVLLGVYAPPVLKILWAGVKLPFKIVGALFKGIGKLFKRKK